VTLPAPLAATPGQTVGPFFGYALPFPDDNALVPPGTPGSVRLHGRVLDGHGEPVPDAILELWQADADGNVVQEQGSLRRGAGTKDGAFTGFGRASTDTDGHYEFTTVVPGAPFFAITVFARGLLNRLFTRAYLPGMAGEPFLETLEADRRSTLITTQDETGYVFDVHLQGERETVFLAYPRHEP
jgi:protocatechuate 3,4-dioxygenase alpha subunit